jgi:hypothetical protein
VKRDQRFVTGERGELVRGTGERQTGELRDPLRALPGVPGMCVEPGPDRRAAERHFVHGGQCRVDRADREIELTHPPGDLLSERERRGVLQVRPTDLDDVGELFCFAVECVV